MFPVYGSSLVSWGIELFPTAEPMEFPSTMTHLIIPCPGNIEYLVDTTHWWQFVSFKKSYISILCPSILSGINTVHAHSDDWSIMLQPSDVLTWPMEHSMTPTWTNTGVALKNSTSVLVASPQSKSGRAECRQVCKFLAPWSWFLPVGRLAICDESLFCLFFPLFLGYIFNTITTKGGMLPTKGHYCSIPRHCVMEQALNDLWSYLYALMYALFYDIYHLGHHLWSATINNYHKSFTLIWIRTDLKFCLPSRELLCHPPVWVIPDLSIQLQIKY